MRAGALGSAIDELQALDPDTLGDGELHELVVELHTQTDRLEAAKATLLAAWQARKVWATDGSKAPSARLERDVGIAPRTAAAQCRRARKLTTMPLTAAALAAGALSVDHVDALARCNTPLLRDRFADAEALLVRQAKTLSYRQLVKALAYWLSKVDPDGARSRTRRERDGRRFHCSRSFFGAVELTGTLDRVQGTAVLNELARLEAQLFTDDLTEAKQRLGVEHVTVDQLARSAPQRRADALVLMAERSAVLPDQARRPEPLITVLVGYETFHGALCELEDGTVLTPDQILPLLATADIERIVFGARSRVLDVGVRERFFTGALRRAIQVRDRHCQHPGCHVPASQCEVDHITPHAAGGETTQANGRLLCRRHNRARNDHPPWDT